MVPLGARYALFCDGPSKSSYWVSKKRSADEREAEVELAEGGTLLLSGSYRLIELNPEEIDLAPLHRMMEIMRDGAVEPTEIGYPFPFYRNPLNTWLAAAKERADAAAWKVADFQAKLVVLSAAPAPESFQSFAATLDALALPDVSENLRQLEEDAKDWDRRAEPLRQFLAAAAGYHAKYPEMGRAWAMAPSYCANMPIGGLQRGPDSPDPAKWLEFLENKKREALGIALEKLRGFSPPSPSEFESIKEGARRHLASVLEAVRQAELADKRRNLEEKIAKKRRELAQLEEELGQLGASVLE